MPVLKFRDKETGEWVEVSSGGGGVSIPISDQPPEDSKFWIDTSEGGEGGSGGSNVAPPDWNQNDPEAPDYVKNRTHYSEVTNEELVKDLELTTEDSGDYAYVDIPTSYSFVPGQEYTVIFDGTTYNCVARGLGPILLGNGEMCGWGGGNGEPFCIEGWGGDNYLNTPASGTHTLSISTVNEVVHKIDAKYLPDSQADWSQSDEKSRDYIKNRTHYLTSDWFGVVDEAQIFVGSDQRVTNLHFENAILANEDYYVTFDDEWYELKSWVSGDEDYETPPVCIGNGSLFNDADSDKGNGEHFCIVCWGGSDDFSVYASEGLHTLDIEGMVHVAHPLEKKYLPEDTLQLRDLNRHRFPLSNVWPNNVCGVAYGNGKYLAVFESDIMQSEDGKNWEQVYASSLPKRARYLLFGADKFVAITNTDTYMYSSDGLSWSAATAPKASTLEDAIYADGVFIGVDSYLVRRSEDGVNWTDVSVNSSAVGHIVYGNGVFVVLPRFFGSSYKTSYYSTDKGLTWLEATGLATNVIWQAVAYGAGKFVAVNNQGGIAYSTDGQTWQSSDSVAPFDVYYLVYGNGKFVAAGNYSTDLAYSEDGLTWTTCEINAELDIEKLLFLNDMFFALVNDGYYYSYDGVNWVCLDQRLLNAKGEDVTDVIREVILKDTGFATKADIEAAIGAAIGGSY